MTVNDLYVSNMDMISSTKVTIYGNNRSFRGECSDIPRDMLNSKVGSFCYSDGAYIIILKNRD